MDGCDGRNLEDSWSVAPVDLNRYERELRAGGFEKIAGVDETGRGAWAGPLVVAAVILPKDFDLDGIRDSKELSPRQLATAFERIVTNAAFSVCWAEAGTIERHGLDYCNLRLLRRAAHKLNPEPDYVLIDGSNPVPWIRFPSKTIEKGDALSVSIAAASIVAKVTRDRIMNRLHQRFPEFGFNHNHGYGTPNHRAALDRLGPTPVHRLNRRTRRFIKLELS
jgi:ribonuclease HII